MLLCGAAASAVRKGHRAVWGEGGGGAMRCSDGAVRRGEAAVELHCACQVGQRPAGEKQTGLPARAAEN